MLCKSPYMAGAIAFGCGQCLHCRISRARLWQYRQVLESFCHPFNCFVTLTYDDQHLPGSASLEPRDLQLFLKRLRAAVAPHRVRFFAVGEYGEKNRRPHYHLSLFGLSEAVVVHGKPCAVVDHRGLVTSGWFHDCWGRGGVHLGEFNWKTAGYTCGYITKFLGDRAKGIKFAVPEFSRMSLRPGIGGLATRIIASSLVGNNQALKGRDVPGELRFGGRKFQLGRYLLKRLRNECGFAPDYSKKFRDEVTLEQSREMCALLASDESVSTFKEAYLKASRQARLSQEARSKIYRKSGSL